MGDVGTAFFGDGCHGLHGFWFLDTTGIQVSEFMSATLRRGAGGVKTMVGTRCAYNLILTNCTEFSN